MSYNYDINPWDDNYSPNTGQMSANQAPATSGYSTDGYGNPLDQFNNTGGYQYQQPVQAQQEQYQQEQTEPDQQPSPPTPPQKSAIRRFINQHVPLCGSFLDTMSAINLPFIDALVQNVNGDLLVSKMFYFFFYSAFGSLFPLMGVYFKQLGMNPAQVGILTGVRPFIEIFSAPFWNSLAERFHKSKALLLFSVLSWIVFTHSLAHIRPPASACVAFNDTYYVLYTPYSNNDLSNYDVGQLEETTSTSEPTPPVTDKVNEDNNELFMNKIPSNNPTLKDKEGKDEILASEENQSVQGKRRKKRQVNHGDNRADSERRKLVYKLADDESKDDTYESHFDLDIDLENDFDDKLIRQDSKTSNRLHQPSWSFFEAENEEDGDKTGENDEMDQLYLKGTRYERSVDMKGADDMLGESDESDQDEQENKEEEQEETEEERADISRKKQRGKLSSGANNRRDDNDYEVEKGDREESTKSTPKAPPVTTTTTEMPYEMNTSPSSGAVNKTKRVYKQRHRTPPTHIVGMSPITVEYAVNYNKEKHGQFVTPMFSTIVYKLDDIKEVFFLLLLLISLGEFFSAPALTLADSATLGYLGENTDLYGRQRMFGSLSWAITLLLVGMALDNATSIADHPCGPHQRERSYTVCFIIFSLLMVCAFLTATQFRFDYPKALSSNGAGGQALMATTTTNSNQVITTTVVGSDAGNIDKLYASTQPRSIFNTAPPVNAPPPNGQQGIGKEKFEFLDKWKSAVFAQRTGELPEWVNVFRQFKNSLHLTYLFITWFLGCGVGLVFTFLFWHLQDIGGTPTLFGICSVINHISEILAYFFSFSFIKRFGHTRVSINMCWGGLGWEMN